MQENENAASPGVRARPGLEVAEPSHRKHEPIVNVPPARVESACGTDVSVPGLASFELHERREHPILVVR